MFDPERAIRLRGSARTSVGQVRENNEDCVWLWRGKSYVLAVVADGMGGAAAGEEASRIAVESIQSVLGLPDSQNDPLEHVPPETLTRLLRQAIERANLSIMQRAIDEPEMRGMGTTVTLAFVRGTDTLIAHVGDSRGYQVSHFNHGIRQITADHSFVEALLAAGHITREQAEEHPMRNVLYRALGQTEDVDIDLYHSDLQIGDRLVLCTDGLTRHVKPHEIAQIALDEDNPERSSERLIDLANARGGEDNVSVIVVLIDEDTTGPRMMLLDVENEDETIPMPESPQHDKNATVELNLDELEESTREPDPRDHIHRDRPDTGDCSAPPLYEPSQTPSNACGRDGEGRDTLAPYQ